MQAANQSIAHVSLDIASVNPNEHLSFAVVFTAINPGGKARFQNDADNMTTIVNIVTCADPITSENLCNVGFASPSAANNNVVEGASINVTVVRYPMAFGSLFLSWELTPTNAAPNAADPATDFRCVAVLLATLLPRVTDSYRCLCCW